MIENATNEFVDDVVFEHAFAYEFVEASLGLMQEDVIDVGNNRIVYCAVGLFQQIVDESLVDGGAVGV